MSLDVFVSMTVPLFADRESAWNSLEDSSMEERENNET